MQTKYPIHTLQALSSVVATLQDRFDGQTIYLEGDLGAGKTTFSQLWLARAGVTEIITSPTYAIANYYSLPNRQQAIHADLYRICDPDELLYLDVRDWTSSAQIILIEWPQNGSGYIPEPDAVCKFNLFGTERELVWEE